MYLDDVFSLDEVVQKEPPMFEFIYYATQLIFMTAAGGFIIWGSVKLLDKTNDKNSLFMAFFASFMIALLGLGGTFFLFLPIVGLLYLFVSYYELGILKSFLIGIMVSIPLFVLKTLLLMLFTAIKAAL